MCLLTQSLHNSLMNAGFTQIKFRVRGVLDEK
jgi:hypothetical protein